MKRGLNQMCTDGHISQFPFTVHGFDMAAYSTDENSAILTGTFGLNRKGVTSVPLIGGIPGRITSMGITATGEILQ